MKCGNYVRWGEKTNKKGRLYRRATSTVSPYHRLVEGYEPAPDMVKCDGDLKVTVEAVDEHYFGGASAEFRAEYTCTACGWVDKRTFGTSQEEVSKLLTKALAYLPEDALDERYAKLREEHLTQQRELKEYAVRHGLHY